MSEIAEALSKKPSYGSVCNQCGWCCMMEVCSIGKEVYGKEQQSPCPALIYANNRHWCKFVLAEDMLNEPSIIGTALGIGKGCCENLRKDYKNLMGRTNYND